MFWLFLYFFIGLPFWIVLFAGPIILGIVAYKLMKKIILWVAKETPKKEATIFDKLYSIRDEDTKIYGFHGLKHAYSGAEMFPGKVNKDGINLLREKVFGLKPMRIPDGKIGQVKKLWPAFTFMLYQREVLKRNKQWTPEKEKLWQEVCPPPMKFGINAIYFNYLKKEYEMDTWEHQEVKAHA